MNEATVCDVLGEPASWANCISDELVGLPDMLGATIVDVFLSRNELTLYAKGANGAQSMTVFVIENQDVRQKIAKALLPGTGVVASLRLAI